MKNKIKEYLLDWFAALLNSVLCRVRVRVPTEQMLILQDFERLQNELRLKAPMNPAGYGYKVFSQADEDGIISYLLGKIPKEKKTKTAFEIGCGNGLENNSHFLLLNGYRAYWIDGSQKNISYIEAELPVDHPDCRLRATQAFLDRTNIKENALKAKTFLRTEDVDFFSMDIDGNDLTLAQEVLKVITPKIVCVEYNAKFPLPVEAVVEYNPVHGWAGDDYHGASLQSFITAFTNYRLVCCNIAGTNAFFIRKDLEAYFPGTASAEELFQPARFHFVHLQPGHTPSLKWLRNSLKS
ncbi:MAG: hypothetical protein K2X47_14535 [Bdellovibrionales bacterium]|nr:hypothetical protein [Bdellovibrionales bacterium]